MAKMYYSEAEAAGKLATTPEGLKALADEGKLKVYVDAGKRMFAVAEVDALAGGGGEEIDLRPVEDGGQDAVSLTEADAVGKGPAKEDTVITAEGISIFDDEDLEVEAADPMAKTSIAPSMEDQVSLDGVGSGSGLLDLSQERDDTSLGGVLEDIPESPAGEMPSGGVLDLEAEEASPAPSAGGPMMQPAVVEEIDPSAGAFSGLIVASCLIMLLVGAVVAATMLDMVPPYLEVLEQNLLAVVAVSALATIILAAVGFVIGKSVAGRAQALQPGA